MSAEFTYENEEFDAYARDYEQALKRGLAVSGEGSSYFAKGRVAWLAKCLSPLGARPRRVMDFGCGIGSTAPVVFGLLGSEYFLGVDTSEASISIAARQYGSSTCEFKVLIPSEPPTEMDLVYCNGVFHHIPPPERAAALKFVHRSLRGGGLLALWENNPWNPGTRLVMSRIPFDRHAVTLSALEARRRVRAAGFDILRVDFLFVFPRALRGLRFLEPFLSKAPVGAQYQILARKRSD